MTVAEAEVIVTGNDKGVQAAFDRTKAGMGKLAKDGKKILGDGAKSWGDVLVQTMGYSSRKAGEAVGQIGKAADRTAGDVGRAMSKVGGSGEDAARRLRAIERTLGTVEATAHKVGIGLSAGITAPLLLAGKAGVGLAGDFQQTMSVFRVTADATAADMHKVSAAAIALGKDAKLPGTSSVDAAHAMLELAKAGLSMKDTLSGARGVLELSAAAQIDNATAAKFAADTLQAYGLAGTKAVMVSDLLAASANASTASMTEMADGLAQASAVWSKAGISVQDTVTALTSLANAGIKGSDAGTSLKTMLMALENPTKEANIEMHRLGVNIYDAQGRMLSFRAILAQFEKATASLTQKQRDHALATIFGSDAVRAASVVMLGGIQKFDALEKTVTKQGAAAKTAAAYNDGFKGSLDAATSAGQTMLQNFVAPALPILTDFFKKAGDAASAVDEWSPAAKTAAGYGVVFAASLGPVALGLRGVANVTKTIIGLRGLFTAGEVAKAAALTATGAAAGGATVSTTSLAVATGELSLQARLAAPSLVTEAGAIDSVAGSAIVATGAIGRLRASMALLSGMGIPAVLGAAGVAGMAYVAKDFENSAAGAVAGNRKAYGAYQSKAMASAKNVLRQFGKTELMRQAGTAGAGFTVRDAEQALKDQPAERAAAWLATRSKTTTSIGRYGERVGFKGDPSTEDDVDRALGNMNPDAGFGVKAKKGRKAGKSAEQKAAEKAAREEAQAVASLKDQYYEAAKAVALFGKDQASVSLQYDLDHGKIIRAGQAIARDTIAKLKNKEALERNAEAQKTAADRAKEWADAQIEHAKAMAAAQIGLSDLDRQSFALFGKKFAAITDAHNKQRVMWAVEEEHAMKERERIEGTAAAWKEVVARLTEVRKETKAEDAARVEATAAAWRKVASSLVAYRKEMVKAATGRFNDTMAELQARLLNTGTESEKTKAKLIRMAEAFGTGATAADRIRSGMGRANQALALTMKIDRIESFRAKMKEAADDVGAYFGKASTDLLTNFNLSFRGVVRGFGMMLADMARQQLASGIQRGVSSWVANAVGGMFGGGVKPATGLRISEANALEWADVAPDRSTITVRQKLTWKTDGEFVREVPKSPRSNRTIPLGDVARDALANTAVVSRSPFVFATESGRPVSPRNVQRTLSTILDALKMPHYSLHDLRRSFGSHLARGGVAPHVLQAIMGHERIETTNRHYLTAFMGDMVDAMKHLQFPL